MAREETFFWYDLETFGLDPRYDRIAQFAGLRTTMDLEPVGEPTVLYCRLSDDYLPDPLAGLITSITPQEVEKKGLSEAEFIDRINALFSVPGTCTAGYNSLKFDDEFIRHTLYRNFHDPYVREYKNGNSRWDIIDLARAAHDLRPEGIVWPRSAESGRPSFKLADLMQANNLANPSAHDALNDVMATIAIARLIRSKQPKLFEYCLTLRKKATVRAKLEVPLGAAVLHTASQFTSEWGCSRLVMPLSALESNADSIIAFDLSQDPAALLEWANSASEAEQAKSIVRESNTIAAELDLKALGCEEPLLAKAAAMLKTCSRTIEDLARAFGNARRSVFSVPGITRIAINRQPFISPATILTPEGAKRLGIDVASCLRNQALLASNPMLAVRVRSDADSSSFPTESDVDGQLYSGLFFSDADMRKSTAIREKSLDELWDQNLWPDNDRINTMLWRYLCRNWPESLQNRPEQQARWKSFCANRLLKPPVDQLLTFEKYQNIIDGKLADLDVSPAQKEVLVKFDQWGKRLRTRIGLDL